MIKNIAILANSLEEGNFQFENVKHKADDWSNIQFKRLNDILIISKGIRDIQVKLFSIDGNGKYGENECIRGFCPDIIYIPEDSIINPKVRLEITSLTHSNYQEVIEY